MILEKLSHFWYQTRGLTELTYFIVFLGGIQHVTMIIGFEKFEILIFRQVEMMQICFVKEDGS